MTWRPPLDLIANELLDRLGATDMSTFSLAVTQESHRRIKAFSDGVQYYASVRRTASDVAVPDSIWTDGTTRLLDYGGDGPPILIVPSLINRYHVLDLTVGYNFVGGMKRSGFRPFIVDWGSPGESETAFGLDDYIIQRLEPALSYVREQTGEPSIGVVGYCMGGLLATALATRRPEQVRALALLATPWDFHADQGLKISMFKASLPQINAIIDSLGNLPVDVLQAMFVSLDPWQTISKFQRFANMKTDSQQASAFVELEDWLNDGVPLVKGVAKECLNGWYANNAPHVGEWLIDGKVVDPSVLTMPVLAAIPETDHIVPPQSARSLAEVVSHSEVMSIAAGHIGMVAGSRAEKQLCRPLSEWFRRNM